MSVTFAVGEASSAHAKSEEISNDWLDRLTVPPTNITYNSYRIAEINRTSESITPIEFVFPGTLITEQTDTYAYKAYLETILNHGTGEETILKPQGDYTTLDHPLILTANSVDKTTPHAHYTALNAERKETVENSLLMEDRVVDGNTM
ncbi:unnamed protein product [Pocillopora meandrina]|uniref:Uncharacterized protein n=1 Tax=Pocillopora meandrina TaxID=46732 RepID=A0AAU9W193_9CNID|nr:unnamed protein product [Pocillopora meandrina]